jgi:hypothetical protein
MLPGQHTSVHRLTAGRDDRFSDSDYPGKRLHACRTHVGRLKFTALDIEYKVVFPKVK